jgi:hypothetical protein
MPNFLSNMGCDGGSIPKREELVKQKQKPEIPDAFIQMLTKWTRCTLSKTELIEPVVCDLKGRLYNKSNLLEYLLDKSTYGDGDIICPHVKGMKDVVTLKLVGNRSVTTAKEDRMECKWICPITGKEMNGKTKFISFKKCGCTMTQEALDQIQGTSCLVCGTGFEADDIIILNPTGEDEVIAEERVKAAMAQKQAKKDKKRKKTVEPALLSSSDEERKKQKLNSNINMVLPDLSHVTNMKPKSKAIASLFAKDEEREKKQNFLTRGMFNRYVAH